MFDKCTRITETQATRAGQICAECLQPQSKDNPQQIEGLQVYQYKYFGVTIKCRHCRQNTHTYTIYKHAQKKTQKIIKPTQLH